MSTLARNLLVWAMACGFIEGAHAAPAFDPDAKAAQIRGAVTAQASNRKDVQKNWVAPFMGNTQLATPDGQPFDVSISCEGERKALDMVLVPGVTGDIDTLTIKQDLGNDGITDTNSALPFAVSGICANGVVSCDLGGWTGCQYYRWTAAGSGEVSMNAVTANELGGCYCINNHCGNNLVMTNLNSIFGDLMGGAMAAVNAQTTQHLPSRVEIDGITASYWVRGILQSGAGCANPAQPNTAYTSNPANLLTDAQTAKGGNAVYNFITTSTAAQESASTLSACTVKRKMTITHDNNLVPSCQIGTWFAVSQTAATFDTVGDDAWLEAQAWCDPTGPLQIRVRAWDGSGNGGCNAAMGADGQGFVNLTMPAGDQINNGYVMTHPNLYKNTCYDVPVLYSGSCVSADGGCAYSFRFFNGNKDNVVDGNGDIVDSRMFSTDSCAVRAPNLGTVPCIDVPGGGSVAYSRDMSVDINFIRPHNTPVPDLATCRVDQEWVDNQCQAFEQDAKCRLMNEDIDGVALLANFQPTGNLTLAGTVSQSDGACLIDVTRDWWNKDRDYRCNNVKTYNFDDAISRVALVQDSTDLTTMKYKDPQKVNGAWVNGGPGLSLGSKIATAPVPICTQACKTRLERINTDASPLGVDADQRTSALSYDYHYKECSAAAVCPLVGAEQLVTDCTCMNNFGEAAAMVQVMRLGARDLVCTSGTPQMPQ